MLLISAKRVCVRRENCFGGLRTNVRGKIGNFNVPRRGFCQVWLNAYSLFIPADKHAITILDTYGLTTMMDVEFELTTQKTYGPADDAICEVIGGVVVRLTTCKRFTNSSPELSHITQSVVVVTQIRGHIAGAPPPLPTTVRAFIFIARRIQHFLPSSDSRRIVPNTHGARRSQQQLVDPFFFHLCKKKKISPPCGIHGVSYYSLVFFHPRWMGKRGKI